MELQNEKELFERVASHELSASEAMVLIKKDFQSRPVTKNQPDKLDPEMFALTDGQLGLWSHQKLIPQSTAYNIPLVFNCLVEIDTRLLKKTWASLCDRHKCLKAVFFEKDGTVYQSLNQQVDLIFKEIELTDTDRDVVNTVESLIQQSFKLQNELPAKLYCLKCIDKPPILVFLFHHIVIDGISLGIIIKDFQHFYLYHAGQQSNAPAEQTTIYDNFQSWQKNWLASTEGQQAKKTLLKKLTTDIQPLDIYTGKKKQINPTFNGEFYLVDLNKALSDDLHSFARENDISVFSIMLSVFILLLYRYSHQQELIVATPFAARPRAEFENQVGFFTNLSLIKGLLEDQMSFKELMVNIKEEVIDLFGYGHYPFTLVQQDISLKKRVNRLHQQFHAAFYFQSPIETEACDSKTILLARDLRFNQTGESDLVLDVVPAGDHSKLYFKYNPDKYAKDVVVQLSTSYLYLLQQVVKKSDQEIAKYSLLPPPLETKTKGQCLGAIQEFDDSLTLFNRFRRQVEIHPKKTAVCFEDQELSYQTLMQLVEACVGFFDKQGIKRGTRVGILMSHGLELLIGLLGFYKIGATYVPLDPTYPAKRLSYILNDTATKLLVTEPGIDVSSLSFEGTTIIQDSKKLLNARIANGRKISALTCQGPKKEDIAYIIYTSGSTGNPKGVRTTQKGLLNFLLGFESALDFSDRDKTLSLTSICFDPSILELFLPLITGGSTEILPASILKNGNALKEKIENSGATVIQATPATYKMLFSAGWEKKIHAKILCGGESLTPELADALQKRGTELWNVYGPTEGTVWSALGKIETDDQITVGRPICNMQYYVLDKNRNPVPNGVSGELYIGGIGLADGYENLAEKTRDTFLTNPFHPELSANIYKSGDVVRLLPNGNIQYIDRIDNQVKLRGYRIELNEIEAVIKKNEGYQYATVVVRKDKQGHDHLMAFLNLPENDLSTEHSRIRQSLKKSLPGYMIPARFIFLKTFPLTLSRKVNRKYLATAPFNEIIEKFGTKDVIPAATAYQVEISKPSQRLVATIESQIKRIISAILDIPASQIDEDQYLGEYGFDSIRFTDFSNQLSQKYLIDIDPTVFFEATSVEAISKLLVNDYYEAVAKIHADSLNTQDKTKQDPAPPSTIGKTCEVIKNHEIKVPTTVFQPTQPIPIAVIGAAGRFPQSDSIDELWDHLEAQTDLITKIPVSRWDWESYFGDAHTEVNKTSAIWGGFINEIDQFDPLFFGISPREAELMDPQHRLFLEVVWHAIENAGYDPRSLAGSKTGVLVGIGSFDYWQMQFQLGKPVDNHTLSGISHAVAANRVSYLLDLKGPSSAIDTACSSSLVAIHRAIKMIKDGQCDLAIAGGVNLIMHPYLTLASDKGGMMSPVGRCKTFDASADGYVRSEGVGAVLLKPLSNAERDGDYVYAVIKGSAENHGGKTNSLTAPNPTTQADLLLQAYQDADISPATVSYIETHGTGTALGDPIEINGLKLAFKQYFQGHNLDVPKKGFCSLGSIKSNVGHLEAAAGIAGFIKLLMSLKNKTLPGVLHFKKENPYLKLDQSPFYVQRKTSHWHRLRNESDAAIPRRCGISSFGFGGSYAHIVLEEYETKTGANQLSPLDTEEQIIPLSARSKAELKQYAERLLDFLKKQGNQQDENSQTSVSCLADIAFTLQNSRTSLPDRLALVVTSIPELVNKLVDYTRSKEDSTAVFNNRVEKGTQLEDITAGKAGEVFLNALLQERDLSKLARFWTMGLKIDWQKLHPDKNRKRVPLPGYPFNRKRYWIEEEDSQHPAAAQNPAEPQQEKTNHQTLCIVPTWRKKELTYSNSWCQNLQTILVIVDDENHRKLLESTFKKMPGDIPNIILIQWASGFNREKPDVFCINNKNENEFAELLAILQKENLLPDAIVQFASSKQTTNSKVFEKSIADGIDSIFRLTRTLFNKKIRNLKYLFVYSSANNEPVDHHVAVNGFFRTLRKENRNYVFKTVEIDNRVRTLAVDSLLKVLDELDDQSDHDVEVRLLDKSRATRTLEEISADTIESMILDQDLSSFKMNGNYLVTGGVGGLGLKLARHLALNYQANLILTGRTQVNDEISRILEEFSSNGSEVHYINADIAIASETESLIARARETLGQLDGILHCAGIVNDSLFFQKSESDFKQVILPKVFGTRHLDHFTREEKLDCFIMFSSLSALSGNQGQCDYAYANAFMDSFAISRDHLTKTGARFGKSLSISWPLWREGGMKVDLKTAETIKNLKGIVPIDTELGIKALEWGLNQDRPHFAIMHGIPDKLPKLFEFDYKTDRVGASTAKPIESAFWPVKEATIQKQTTEDLLIIASEILRLPQSEISSTENLSSYGLDSLGLVEFTNRIKQSYQIEVSPALFYEYQSIDAISTYLLQTFGKSSGMFHKGKQPKETKPGTPQRTPFNRLTTNKVSQENDIAIIGLSCKMPQVDDPSSFWEALVAGEDLISQLPADRMELRQHYHTRKNPIYPWGGFINDVDAFDAAFFGIAPHEASLMDPQQRIFLEVTWKAIEDAGYKASDLSGSNTGVFVGVATADYRDLIKDSGADIEEHSASGISHSVLANRVSYFLNLKGPSEPIDAACSSALVAVHRGINAIRNGNCDLVLAGGVNVILTQIGNLYFKKAGVLSPGGRCRPFDANADGYVRGEGCGVVVLKGLKQAIRDNDYIYAVVKSSSQNHNGSSNTLTAPNVNAQAEAIVSAYGSANVDFATVSYIEAHGTGTKLGDSVEMQALMKACKKVEKEGDNPGNQLKKCAIGSVKSNIGHLETAAGAAGLIKLCLAFKHKILPPSINYNHLNPFIPDKNNPFYVLDKKTEWHQDLNEKNQPIPRRAGLSSFGFGGTNAHLVLEEFTEMNETSGPADSIDQLFVFSAKNRKSLEAGVSLFIKFLKKIEADSPGKRGPFNLRNIAYTLQKGREEMEQRLAVVAKAVPELIDKLNAVTRKTPINSTVFQGKVSRSGRQDTLVTDNDLALWHQQRELLKLGQVWINGAGINWDRLYDNPIPKRIPLPTYQFQKTRFWIQQSTRPGNDRFSLLHPMVHANNSTLDEVRFSSRFSGDEPFIKDHVIGKDVIIPGVLSLEMARAACQFAGKHHIKKLRKLAWLNPVRLNGRGTAMKIRLQQSNGAIKYQIFAQLELEKEVLHAKGEIIAEPISSAGAFNHVAVDLETHKKACSQTLKRDECYQLFSKKGFNYGPGFRPIEELYCSDDYALAKIHLSDTYRNLDNVLLNPFILDAALQSVGGITGHQQVSRGPLLPFSIDEIELFNQKELPEKCYAHSRLNVDHRTKVDSQLKKYNIDLMDEEGTLLLRLKSYSAKANQFGETEKFIDILQKLYIGKLTPEAAMHLVDYH